MAKKNRPRKMIPHTAAFMRRMETQKHQRISREYGIVSPRSLARTVGKWVGTITDEISASKVAVNWKAYMQGTIEYPGEFRSMMNSLHRARG